MNTGIQILIERMKTNPEEFINDEWGRMIRDYWEYMLPEDKTAYTSAYNAMMQDQFTEVVMKKLAGVGDEDGVAASHNDVNPLRKIRMQGWTDPSGVFGQREALRVSTQNNGINQLGMQQYGAGGLGGDSNNTLYAGGGGGGSMLSNFAKSLGFK